MKTRISQTPPRGRTQTHSRVAVGEGPPGNERTEVELRAAAAALASLNYPGGWERGQVHVYSPALSGESEPFKFTPEDAGAVEGHPVAALRRIVRERFPGLVRVTVCVEPHNARPAVIPIPLGSASVN